MSKRINDFPFLQFSFLQFDHSKTLSLYFMLGFLSSFFFFFGLSFIEKCFTYYTITISSHRLKCSKKGQFFDRHVFTLIWHLNDLISLFCFKIPVAIPFQICCNYLGMLNWWRNGSKSSSCKKVKCAKWVLKSVMK